MSTLLAGINLTAAAGLAALLNTLWYAAAVVALAWAALRFWPRVNAATRYWIWIAVLGFLFVLPFLPSLVTHARTALAARGQATVAIEPLATVPNPLASLRQSAPVTVTVNTAPGSNPWPLWLLAAWIIAAIWQLTRLAASVKSVRRLKARSHGTVFLPWAFPSFPDKPTTQTPCRGYHLRRQVRVLTSAEVGSPVAVGYMRPAVIVPPGLLERLEEGERQDVLLHELAHLARYDDWMALATHALGALLSLHPLAPIVLGRIEREREMACDDFVVARTGAARSYARSLARLHDLRWSTGTRLLAPGILGRNSSLGDRIESLLRRGRKFSARPSLASLGVSAILLAALLGAGGLIPGWIAIAQTKTNMLQGGASSQAANSLANTAQFEVASIKPSKPSGPRMLFRIMNSSTDGRFYATGPTVRLLLQIAYHVQDSQIVGGPSWINSDRFDIQAKADSSVDDQLKKLSRDQAELVKEHMLQELLATRFKLNLRRETRELPVYALVVSKNGPKIQKAKEDATSPVGGGGAGPRRGVMMRAGGGEQQLSFEDSPISFFVEVLAHSLGRTVVDQTGLKGKYNFNLHWAPETMGMRGMGGPGPGGAAGPDGNGPLAAGAPSSPAPDSSGPSIFTALQQQLGLRLKPAKGPVEVLVIDHIEQPSAN